MATKAPGIIRVGDGRLGTIIETETDIPGQLPPQVDVLLEDGQRLMVSSSLLVSRPDGTYGLDLETPVGRESVGLAEGDELIVPVVAESAEVTKRRVETGRVRVRKTIRSEEKVVDQPVTTDEVDVVRVPINRVIAEAVGPRQEGETLIIPLMEEVLVVEKRLVLREELRITRRQIVSQSSQTVLLRSEQATVERYDATAPEIND